MSHKSKGINAERELIHMFWQTNEWAACRVAGSGSSRYPSADVLASNSLRKLAIESKITKDNAKYFSVDEVHQLKEFSRIFGAEPWFALKFKGNDWLFLSLHDLDSTNKSYVISLPKAKLKGLSFNDLVKIEAKGF